MTAGIKIIFSRIIFYFDHSITKINSLKPEKNAKEIKSRTAPLPCLGYEANVYLSKSTIETLEKSVKYIQNKINDGVLVSFLLTLKICHTFFFLIVM